VSSFVKLFRALGYEESHKAFERGVRKVAIYARDDYVLHTAVQPPDMNGLWHSKIGSNVNLFHTLEQLAGDAYGRPVKFMRERKPSRAKRVAATGQRAAD
jgi:hypothetical protein